MATEPVCVLQLFLSYTLICLLIVSLLFFCNKLTISDETTRRYPIHVNVVNIASLLQGLRSKLHPNVSICTSRGG